jgi:hypothetical protein
MTLIEVMVAMVLMATALIAVAAAVPAGLTSVSASGLAITAAGLAQEPLDVAKRTAFANLGSLAESRATVSGFSGFEREVLVASYAAPGSCSGAPCSSSCPTVGGQPTCRTVEVRVYYRGSFGETVTTLSQIFVK